MGSLHRASPPLRSAATAALLCLAVASRLHGADIFVDNTFCSLADAIASANLNNGQGGCAAGDDLPSDVIHLIGDVTVSAAYPGSTSIGGAQAATPNITTSMVIEGNGYGLLIRRDPSLSCESTDDGTDFRLLQLLGGSLTLNNVILSNGCVIDPVLAKGGALYVDSTSTATIGNNTSFLTNTARGSDDLQDVGDAGSASGGAIFVENGGALTVSGGSFRSNLAQGGQAVGTHGGGAASGGGISGPVVSLDYASFVFNGAQGGSAAAGAGGSAFGGGLDSAILGDIDSLYVDGNWAIGGSSSTGEGGTAGGGGASMAPGPSGTRTLTGGWFFSNFAGGGNGSSGGLSVGGGLAVSFANATLAVRNSTWNDNYASGGFAGAEGGALCVGCLFASPALVTLANVTLYRNTASASGGGVFSSGSLTLGSVTVAGNRTFGGPTSGAGIYASGDLTIGSSIVADNQSYYGVESSDCSLGGGTYTSAGYNWIETASATCPANGVNDHGGDPGLGSFGQHGSAAFTVALTATSPAIDQGSCSAGMAVPTDERGYARPQDLPPANALLGCDPGAFELFDHDFEIAVVDSADPVVASAPGPPLTDTVTLTNIGYSATSGIDVGVTFVLPSGVTLGGHSMSTGAVTCDLTTCEWTGVSVPAGASATLEVSLNVAADALLSFVMCTAEVTAAAQVPPGGLTALQVTYILPRKVFENGFENGTTGWSAVH